MFNKILIANRGEIAVRVIRASKELGVDTVAVYSEADADSLHVMMADEAVCIGPPKAGQSYLNISNILSAAVQKGADAIHPGFGFLSENSEFAHMCEEIGIKFIGPSSDAISKLGNKSLAKQLMAKHGVPVIPGPDEGFTEAEYALEKVKHIGFPLLIKAVAGGGGRGIRLIEDEHSFVSSFQEASYEADLAFNDPNLYVEKYFENPKHIEIQVIADEHGNCIHLGERDCSSQRRKQKVIEETPSPVMDEDKRKNIGSKVTQALKQIGYTNAGTVEFLYENGKFYFMEMNTRIQVEHPITEITTSTDLIKEQIQVASGEKLRWKQNQIRWNNHAIECRINAEDPNKNFMPSPGTIHNIVFPSGPGIRIDSGIYPGAKISPHYDSMVAKVIAFDNTRKEAIARMIRALEEFYVSGIQTNKDFLIKILSSESFLNGNYSINFIEKELM
ncbi:MAG: acetyl-CoA carboxylase biotin carboxylase subunit [Bacteroidales bacterium]|nr:acetyl-CoA carboxylase biotin carboxylase subunit [Bacteroidales bacterium]MBS3773681.1 acetyl-CoA carboxylase biotin carboxylase subunit [Bacteroidales bacterium]